ncbi:KPN_02809 family neutral zinc metallopeptidase [Vibrio sp. TRT 21S02]|uniref:KPN_02809 family neutral zinc metallopeptidase n=1 Tax=unclassified Vibrio TaxID=2614977 RepID=UPI00349F4AC7
MRWRNSEQSNNIDDRRGQSPVSAGVPAAGLIRLLPFLMRSKVGRIVLLAGGALMAYQHLTGGALPGMSPLANESTIVENDENKQFVSAILATTEQVWKSKLGPNYQEPTLVLYNGMTQTGCGLGKAQTGPFYCPADSKVYLDLSFMDELKKLGAPGDFAFAYVIAHEVGHHVQNQVGTSSEVHQLQQRSNRVEANKLSVMLELQADCYAGVWGHEVDQKMDMLDIGDLEEGLRAANSVGDDHLQKMAGRAVQPDAFTHGTSAQRIEWFKRGFESGDMKVCDTFNSLS